MITNTPLEMNNDSEAEHEDQSRKMDILSGILILWLQVMLAIITSVVTGIAINYLFFA